MKPPRSTLWLPHWRAALFLSAALAASFAQAKDYEDNLQKTFGTDPGGTLVVEADRGAIEVRTGERSDVSIEVRRRLSRLSESAAQAVFRDHEVSFEQEGDRITVRARFKGPAGRFWNNDRNSLQVHYLIAVPARFNLDLNTSAGSIQCEDIEGTVRARTAGGSLKFGRITGIFEGATSAGSISVSGATGKVAARTSGGSIHLGECAAEATVETSAGSISVESVKGNLSARTSGGGIKTGFLAAPAHLQTSAGSIRVERTAAPLEARTSGGSITVAEAGDAVQAETSAGSIKIAFSAPPQADSHLTTSGGGIQVQVPENADLTIEARASGGRVDCRLPLAVTRTSKQRDLLEGKLNGGGKALRLKTSAGSITISGP
jgi:DUF4097 and DUF4098 domain-containing protein YvlB